MQRATILLVLICSIVEEKRTETTAEDGNMDEDMNVTTTTTPNPYMVGKVPKQHKLTPEEEDHRQKDLLMVAAADVIHGTNPMVWRTSQIRERSSQCASFEIGFVLRTMEESYKKMLDMYNTTVQLGIKNNNRGRIHYLQRVEKLHWEVEHLSNMMHEVERKYKMDTAINGSGMFEDGKLWSPTTTATTTTTRRMYTSRKLTSSWWYPLEYGFKPGDYYW